MDSAEQSFDNPLDSQSDESADSDALLERSSRVYIARFAFALLRMPADQEAVFTGPEARSLSSQVEQRLKAALENDTRVSEVSETPRSIDVDNARTLPFFDIDHENPDLISALDQFLALRLNREVVFRVRVPAKNQPRYRNLDDVPSDEYLVVWDGISVAVQWEQDGPRATGSGGHIVLDIICDAAAAAGYEAVIKACTPSCHHRFIHADFVTFERDEPGESITLGGRTPVGRTVINPWAYDPDPVRNLLRTYSALGSAVNQYGQVATLVDSVRFLEARARSDSAAILSIAYERVSRRRLPDVRGAAADIWGLRSSRRATRKLMAGVWLALASTESNVGHWYLASVRLKEVLREQRLEPLLSVLDPEDDVITSLDLSLVRESLQETGSRQDGRTLAIATAAGACAALSGSALTAALT